MIRYRLLVCLTLIASCVAVTSHTRGQGFFRPMSGTPSGRLIEPPRAWQQKLKDAKAALAEGRSSDAVVGLGDLLARDEGDQAESDLAGQDFFLDIAQVQEGVPASQSLLATARRMIGELPADDWEVYELRYGPLAEKRLSEAAGTRDWRVVRDVRRRYFHTLAGYEASALLAQQEIYLGHPLAASLLLDDVAVLPRAVSHLGAGLILLHARACSLAGRAVPRDRGVPRQGSVFRSRNDDWY